MDTKQKDLGKALRTITALDERKRLGHMNPAAQAALEEAEQTVCSVSGRAMLAAFREWRDSGLKSFDPTPAYVRDMAMERSPGNMQCKGRAR